MIHRRPRRGPAGSQPAAAPGFHDREDFATPGSSRSFVITGIPPGGTRHGGNPGHQTTSRTPDTPRTRLTLERSPGTRNQPPSPEQPRKRETGGTGGTRDDPSRRTGHQRPGRAAARGICATPGARLVAHRPQTGLAGHAPRSATPDLLAKNGNQPARSGTEGQPLRVNLAETGLRGLAGTVRFTGEHPGRGRADIHAAPSFAEPSWAVPAACARPRSRSGSRR